MSDVREKKEIKATYLDVVPRSVIISTIYEQHGIISKIAPALKTNVATFYDRYDKDIEIMDHIERARKATKERRLDLAEGVLMRAMSEMDSDRMHAVKASIFYLCRQGKARGYVPEKHIDEGQNVIAAKIDELHNAITDDSVQLPPEKNVE